MAFLAVMVKRKEAFFGALEPSAAEAEEGDGSGARACDDVAFSAAVAAAAATSLSSRGPADTRGDERSKSKIAATDAIARRPQAFFTTAK